MDRDLPLTVEEAAKILKVSKYTLYELIKRGDIPAQRIGRQIRIDAHNLSQYIRGAQSTFTPADPSAIQKSAELSEAQESASNSFHFVGSHDPVLELLADFWKHSSAKASLSLAFKGSMDGLIALYRREAQFSGIHLWDDKAEEYNLPFVHYVLPGEAVVLVNLVQRVQGFIVSPGNPFGLQSWADLAQKGLRFINRQKGSGTRLRLDTYLQNAQISPALLQGYEQEESTHLGVASAVANAQADVGIGVESAAHRMGMDFVPLFHERYDLVTLSETAQTDAWRHLQVILKSPSFQLAINRQVGYDTSLTGQIMFQTV